MYISVLYHFIKKSCLVQLVLIMFSCFKYIYIYMYIFIQLINHTYICIICIYDYIWFQRNHHWQTSQCLVVEPSQTCHQQKLSLGLNDTFLTFLWFHEIKSTEWSECPLKHLPIIYMNPCPLASWQYALAQKPWLCIGFIHFLGPIGGASHCDGISKVGGFTPEAPSS